MLQLELDRLNSRHQGELVAKLGLEAGLLHVILADARDTVMRTAFVGEAKHQRMTVLSPLVIFHLSGGIVAAGFLLDDQGNSCNFYLL